MISYKKKHVCGSKQEKWRAKTETLEMLQGNYVELTVTSKNEYLRENIFEQFWTEDED